jgi:FKBP-type peptidyl-prolyl cis-trans isomerase 2
MAVGEDALVLVDFVVYDENSNVVDGTKGEVARKIYGREGPQLIYLPQAKLVNALRDAITSLSEGEEKEVWAEPKDAFGEYDNKLVKTFSYSVFKRYNVEPKIGTIVSANVDGENRVGVVKSVQNGRVKVDFNHPYAGKRMKYWVKLLKVGTSVEDKVKVVLHYLGLDNDVEVDGNVVKVKGEVREDYQLALKKLVKQLLPDVDVQVEKV